jgi:hypothetical protein
MANTTAKLPTAATTASEAPWSDNDWSNVENIYGAGEASITTPTFDTGDQSYVLKAYTFDMSAIPDGSTINGVVCVINARYEAGQGSGNINLVQLLSTILAKVGTNQAGTPTALSTTATDYTFGGTADTWGNGLTSAWVKNSNFGVAVGMIAAENNADVFIDSVTLNVYYTAAVSITADPGSYSLTGTAATLKATHKITAAAGSYSLTGTAATFVKGYQLSAEPGSFIQTGVDATLTYTANNAAIVLSASEHITASGEDTTAQLTPPGGKTTGDFQAGRIADDENPLDSIDLASGKYTELEWSIKATEAAGTASYEFRVTAAGTALNTYSGTPVLTVTTAANYSITADPGSYSLSGVNASLDRTYIITAAAGTYAYTGVDANLNKTGSYSMTADPGAFVIAGTDASLQKGNKLSADAGAYAVSGTDASLKVGRSITAGPGSYVITGTAVTFKRSYVVAAGIGAYTYTGIDAALTKTGSYSLTADPGSYITAGVDADFLRGYNISADPGSYALTGTDLDFLYGRVMTGGIGAYNITGTDASLTARGAYNPTAWKVYPSRSAIQVDDDKAIKVKRSNIEV